MIVSKFGGTSVGSSNNIKKVIEIIAKKKEKVIVETVVETIILWFEGWVIILFSLSITRQIYFIFFIDKI